MGFHRCEFSSWDDDDYLEERFWIERYEREHGMIDALNDDLDKEMDALEDEYLEIHDAIGDRKYEEITQIAQKIESTIRRIRRLAEQAAEQE